MKKTIKTVKELKELLKNIPDYAEVEHVSDYNGDIIKGVEVDCDSGCSFRNPYVCFCY